MNIDLVWTGKKEDHIQPGICKELEHSCGGKDLHPPDKSFLTLGDSHHTYSDDDEEVEGRRPDDGPW